MESAIGGLSLNAFWMHNSTRICDLAASLRVPILFDFPLIVSLSHRLIVSLVLLLELLRLLARPGSDLYIQIYISISTYIYIHIHL